MDQDDDPRELIYALPSMLSSHAMKPRSVIGVDFSGAALAGRNIWLARCNVVHSKLRLVALDRLEETLDFLKQSIPYRTRWTVFYLQAADATEASALLEQLIPSSSVTNTAESTGFSLGIEKKIVSERW